MAGGAGGVAPRWVLRDKDGDVVTVEGLLIPWGSQQTGDPLFPSAPDGIRMEADAAGRRPLDVFVWDLETGRLQDHRSPVWLDANCSEDMYIFAGMIVREGRVYIQSETSVPIIPSTPYYYFNAEGTCTKTSQEDEGAVRPKEELWLLQHVENTFEDMFLNPPYRWSVE